MVPANQLQSNIAVVLCTNQKYSTEIFVVVAVVLSCLMLLALKGPSADTGPACPVSETRLLWMRQGLSDTKYPW